MDTPLLDDYTSPSDWRPTPSGLHRDTPPRGTNDKPSASTKEMDDPWKVKWRLTSRKPKKNTKLKAQKKFEGMAGQRASWKRRYQKGRDFFRVSFLFLYYLGRAGGFFFVEGGEGVHKRGIFFIIYIKIGYPSYIKKQFRMIFPLFCLG